MVTLGTEGEGGLIVPLKICDINSLLCSQTCDMFSSRKTSKVKVQYKLQCFFLLNTNYIAVSKFLVK